MKGLQNFLNLINEHWTEIVGVLVVAYSIYLKAKKSYADWKAKTEAEKEAEMKKAQDKAIAVARQALGEQILKMVAKAEVDWNDAGSKLGEVKRSQVIAEIYKQYPILETVADQKELLAYIDNLINEALVTVREKVRKEMEKDTPTL